MVTEVDELGDGDPEVVVIENARRKARAGRRMPGEAVPSLGVDTDVALDGRLLGKPGDEAGARERLEALSGRTHEVLSGSSIVERRAAGRCRSNVGNRQHRGHLSRRSSPRRSTSIVASGEWRGPCRGLCDPGSGVDLG